MLGLCSVCFLFMFKVCSVLFLPVLFVLNSVVFCLSVLCFLLCSGSILVPFFSVLFGKCALQLMTKEATHVP